MKAFAFINIIAFMFYIGLLQAQTIYSKQNLSIPNNAVVQENTIQSVFSDLDKSKIPTGVLKDAAVEFVDLERYNGILTDSTYTSPNIVSDLYNTIIMGRMSEKLSSLLITPPIDFQNNWYNSQQIDVIPVAGLFYKYAKFSELSHSDRSSNLEITTSNKIKDVFVAGNWQNPYDVENVFAMAPIGLDHDKKTFRVVFPMDLFQTNEQNNIQNMEVRFSDSENFRPITFGTPMEVSYTYSGNYTWTYRLTLKDGKVLYSHNKFKVVADVISDENFMSTHSTNTSNSNNLMDYIVLDRYQYFIPFPPMVQNGTKLSLSIRYSRNKKEIRKPLIVVEGFDTGHITAPRKERGENNIFTFLKNLQNETYYLNSKLKDYDIIYVDFGKGTDYIQNNAELLKKAIRWVNENKVGTEKNVVLGQSMGGLVARYALKDMEDKGENHDTKLYISHDTPHLGANTPLGLQAMMRNLSKTFLKSPIVAGINYMISPVFWGVPISEVMTITDTPASRQMLINYLDKNYNIDNSVHNAWQEILKAKGYPQQTRNVAISNGSECGSDQNIQNLLTMNHKSKGWVIDFLGALIGGITLDIDQIVLSLLPGESRYHYDFVVRPMTNLNDNKELYNGKIVYKKKIIGFISAQNTLLSGSYYQPKNILPIDRYGGGKYKFPTNSLPKFLGNYIQTNDFSFIPTPSAIDLYRGAKSLTQEDYTNSYSYNKHKNDVPFSNFVAEKMGGNYTHISFDDRIGDFIINQLSADTNLQNKVFTSENICGNNVKIGGGKTLLCGEETSTYNTGSAERIQWSVVKGRELVHINGSSNQQEFSFTTRQNANGLVELRADLYEGTSHQAISQEIWVGVPSITSFVSVKSGEAGIKGLNFPEYKQGITKVEWTDEMGNILYEDAIMLDVPYSNTRDHYYITVKNICGSANTEITIPKPCNPYDIVHWQGDNYGLTNSCERDDNRGYLPYSISTRTIAPKTTLSDNRSIITIQVANAMGQVVLTTQSKTFSLANALPGTYYARVMKNGQVVHTQTLIKR